MTVDGSGDDLISIQIIPSVTRMLVKMLSPTVRRADSEEELELQCEVVSAVDAANTEDEEASWVESNVLPDACIDSSD